MPMYDFRCVRHGVFEAMATLQAAHGVPPQPCPTCGLTCGHVWIKAPAVRNDNRHAVLFGGKLYSAEEVEKMEEKPPDPDAEVDAWLDSPETEARLHDIVERKMAQAASGNLAPVGPPDGDPNSRKVLDSMVDATEKAVANGV